MEHSSINCPGCSSTQNSSYLSVKDHFLSKEKFDLMLCEQCDLLFTHPRPDVLSIGNYYKSEDYVSHSSTKKGLVNQIYNLVRSHTLNKKIKLIASLTNGKNLLDIGAGTGHFLSKAKLSGFQVTGLEPDNDARKMAATLNNVDLLPIEELSNILPASKDIVTMWHVLEHVYNLTDDLTSISTLVKENGVFIIAVPNYTSYDAQYYKADWAAYDVPRHLYHFSPKSIIHLVEKFGFTHEQTLPMKFDSYYVSMLSEKYKGGNLLNAIKTGFVSNAKAKSDRWSSQIYVFRKNA